MLAQANCIFVITNNKDMTYFEFTKRFPDENAAIDFIVATKYKGGYVCPKCGCFHKGIYHQQYNRRFLYCNNCKSEFPALKNTIFENTHLDLRMWLYAMNLVIVSRKGISALQLKREMGMGSYQSAWRMLHQIRKAMENEEYKDTFEAVVEIDETYVGGKPRKKNVHNERETNENFNKRGRGCAKTPVIGVKERNTGKVHAVVANFNEDGKQLSGKQLFNVLKKVCKNNTIVMTDQYSGYNILDKENECNFIRLKVDHSVAYSLGNGIHTNGIESFWAVLKRGVYGVFHNVSVKYMQKYVNEFCYRLNHRDNDEAFNSLVLLAVR